MGMCVPLPRLARLSHGRKVRSSTRQILGSKVRASTSSVYVVLWCCGVGSSAGLIGPPRQDTLGLPLAPAALGLSCYPASSSTSSPFAYGVQYETKPLFPIVRLSLSYDSIILSRGTSMIPIGRRST